MQCNHCRAENPAAFSHCAECGLPLFIAVLKEICEHDAIRSHHIFAHDATIGRHHDNNVILHDASLSRFHARIQYQNGRFYIQDLTSRNGIFVNEAKVRQSEIKDFDRITLGETMLLFRAPRSEAIGDSSRPFINPLMHTQEEFLAAIKDMSQRAKRAVFSNEVFEIAAQFAIKFTNAERAAVFLYDKNGKLQPAFFHNVTDRDVRDGRFEASRAALKEAEDAGEMVIREECLDDPRYKNNKSIQELRLNTIICLPLKSLHALAPMTMHDAETASAPLDKKMDAEWDTLHKNIEAEQERGGPHLKGVLFGVLYLDSRRVLKGLPQHRRNMLQGLADQITLTIEHALLQQEAREKMQLSKQMRAAKEAQQRMFPPPSFSHARFEMAYRYAPAQQIGGDYFAFVPLSESRFLFAIGDVAGKGLSAGLVVMTLHGGLYSEISHHTDLLPLVRNLDRLIHEYSQGKVFVTFFAAMLDIETMQLHYSNAGHNPPLLYRSAGPGSVPLHLKTMETERRGQGWCELLATGMPLGLDPHSERAEETIALQSGDLLTLFTDGIIEAHNSAKKQFGKEGLKKVLSSWLVSPRQEQPPLIDLVNTVFARMQHFTNHKNLEDDITLMAAAVK